MTTARISGSIPSMHTWKTPTVTQPSKARAEAQRPKAFPSATQLWSLVTGAPNHHDLEQCRPGCCSQGFHGNRTAFGFRKVVVAGYCLRNGHTGFRAVSVNGPDVSKLSKEARAPHFDWPIGFVVGPAFLSPR